ncbi:MAG: DUF1934 domain-containing protein [Bacillaceae bacterium]
MKEEVSIKFVTEIRDRQRKENVSFTTTGTFYQKQGNAYLTFQEPVEEGEIQTIIKIKEDEALIMRSGQVSMRNVYRRQCETKGTYQSSAGTFEMTTKTDAFQFAYDEKKKRGKLFFSYTLMLQEQHTGRYTITIMFK